MLLDPGTTGVNEKLLPTPAGSPLTLRLIGLVNGGLPRATVLTV